MSDENEHENEHKNDKLLREIREMCGWIMHQTYQYEYGDDYPLARLACIEGSLEPIRDLVNKLRAIALSEIELPASPRNPFVPPNTTVNC